MKTRSLLLFSALLLILAQPAFAKSPKIGEINMQKAINNSEEGAKSRAYFEKKAAGGQEKFKKQGMAIQQRVQALQDNLMLSEAARNKEIQEIEKQKEELRQAVNQAQQEFKEDEMRHLQRISQDLMLLVKKIGEKRSFDMVVETSVRQAMLYTSFEIEDITDEVVAEYNKMKAGK
ncbi:MAG: hypothetical protein A2508_08205 [Candidatus Lambdaproteobacteria bacterium RIFOXYD12_FULL_49_8]|uniref:OmpH family outer membrane protein n=1 Tax=Candidatus Lambdaproteobacteria bacterium RIFOXYD2_FULL_50_16 TaxID=1817772 RepID=A0A1F6GFX9_9PROT|nr:MAG: hypothetical protein A2527_02815 [Candidatus Lambdaproteobacteria bacterium RIFOXYD2_FULL_50_16]OGG97957.1 MAG: hypothetical protein A2508_08205 [Candidatus Lambdaproteobacteria bacterium RIFOXYD12_FULL_49_8]